MPSPPLRKPIGRAVRTRHPNHVFMTDVTLIPSMFRISLFHVAVVFDVFSRLPLTGKVFASKPSGDAMAALMTAAAEGFGAPRHFVSDHGTYFTASAFRETLARLRIKPRFGAIGESGSIALIERFFRTVKTILRAAFSIPLIRRDLEDRLELALIHYAHFRPHQALGGATPAEVYLGLPPAHLAAVPPPRGQPGHDVGEPPFEISFLDEDGRLPVLLPKAA